MPYIPVKDRGNLDLAMKPLLSQLQGATAGELNYVISTILWGQWKAEQRYATANALVGVLECVKAEFLRRQLSPYEDGMIDKNGDLEV